MKDRPLRTSVIGSYPFPGWLEFASQNLSQFGSADLAEMQDDAVTCAVHDQLAAGLDVELVGRPEELQRDRRAGSRILGAKDDCRHARLHLFAPPRAVGANDAWTHFARTDLERRTREKELARRPLLLPQIGRAHV